MKTILAPTLIEYFREGCPHYAPTYKHIVSALISPIDPNHAPRHPSLGELVADQARQRAEIFCFNNETINIIYSMMVSERRRNQILRNARFPFPRMFFEYAETSGIRVGLFVEGNHHNCTIHRVDLMGDPVISLTMKGVSLQHLSTGVLQQYQIAYYEYPGMEFRNDDGTVTPCHSTREFLSDMATKQIIAIVAAVCTFLTLGGACVIAKTITREGRKARKRGRAFAMGAIDSYNSVSLKLPRRSIESDATHFKRGPGVRWHRVAGHWREYSHNERRVLGWMTYIANYERGDPRKGIVVKERDVIAA